MSDTNASLPQLGHTALVNLRNHGNFAPAYEQRCEELTDALRRLAGVEAVNQRMELALTRLRDCDWVISLPDRMDAVRAIAREALLPPTPTEAP